MKKLFYTLLLTCMFSLMVGFSSCTQCSKAGNEVKADTVLVDSTVVDSTAATGLVVENLISMDRQQMYNQYAKDYRWFESCILLKDFLDEDCDGTVAGVSNIFQVVEESEDGKTFDVHVVMFAHTPDTAAVEVVHSFWVEDLPMENEAIKVTFKEAFEKVMAVNYPKPHSQHVVLRKQLGLIDANPQYIFGNTESQLYVDAVTGAVTDKNPVFPEDVKLAKPLGEWP